MAHKPITNVVVMNGEQHGRSRTGHFHLIVDHKEIVQGLRAVNVQLSGWNLNLKNPDKHQSRGSKQRTLDHIWLQLSNVRYESDSGQISFRLDGHCHGFDSDVDDPKHQGRHTAGESTDDDFEWSVFYTIVGFS